MFKLLFSIIALLFLAQFSFANNGNLCSISDYSNGYDGKLSFKCDEDISLSDNRAVFYIVGNTDLDKIELSGVKVKFKSYKIYKTLTKVSVNLVTEGVLSDSDYIVNKNAIISLKLIFSGDSNPKYKVLWGGVIKNSYKQKKAKSNNIQIYQNLDGRVYFYKNGLKCAIKDDCSDRVYIDKNCKNDKNCNKFDDNGKNEEIYGLVS